jgi:hypothetical protein
MWKPSYHLGLSFIIWKMAHGRKGLLRMFLKRVVSEVNTKFVIQTMTLSL